MIQLLLVGGNEMTTNAIGNGMLLLMRNPKVVEMLRADKADWESRIEEFLRLESPVRGFWRLALRDIGILQRADPSPGQHHQNGQQTRPTHSDRGSPGIIATVPASAAFWRYANRVSPKACVTSPAVHSCD